MATPDSQPRRRTQRERVEETSQRLLSAAVELIAENGFDRTTTAEISRRAGMSNSMVHMRYGSKEALLEALLRSYEHRMLAPHPAPEENGLQQLVGHVEAVRAALNDQPSVLRAFFMIQFEIPTAVPHLREWLVDWFHRYVDHIAASIRRGQDDGSVRRNLQDPVTEARFFLAHGIGLGFQWILDPHNVDLDTTLVEWRELARQHFTVEA